VGNAKAWTNTQGLFLPPSLPPSFLTHRVLSHHHPAAHTACALELLSVVIVLPAKILCLACR